MIKLVQVACQRGQKDFDGWAIGRARYCLHSRLEPASCESTLKKTVPGYVPLETTVYGAGCLSCQSLEICLVDINVLRNIRNVKGAGCMPGQLTMILPLEDLKNFLSVSGGTNPIHYKPDVAVPGLWVLSRLEELYGSHRPVETFSIRFLYPVRAGGSVRLIHKNNVATGTVGSTTYLTMTIHSLDQT